MYIISIYDGYPDGDRYSSAPKITKKDAVQYVVDVMQTKYRSTDNVDKRIEIRNLIEHVGNGDMSMISDKEHTIAYDIVTRDEWEVNRKEKLTKQSKKLNVCKSLLQRKSLNWLDLKRWGICNGCPIFSQN